jgi:uncharacterized membrane protein
LALIWTLVLALHLLAMAYWIGGATYAVLISGRVVSLLDANQKQSVIMQSWTRFFRSVWHVFGLSVVTGFALILHEGGFAVVPMPVDIMMLLGLAMGAWSIVIARGPLTRARRALRPQPALLDSVRKQTIGVVALGLLAILAAAFARGI